MNPKIRALRAGVLAALCAAGAGSALAQAPAATAPAQRVTVTDITVSGNTLLPQALIDSTVAPYRGSRTVDELKQAAVAVQALYRQAGYGAVVAFLPEQALGSGRLQITVLEGKVAKVVVQGNQQFSAANVRLSLPLLQEGQTPQVQAIDAQVQLANENPARRLALTLEEGQKPGEVDARVTVTEDPISRFSLSADNTGNAQTGRIRLSAAYQNANLWDLDHQLSAQVQFAPEHPSAVKVFSASYRVPIYGTGFLVQAYGTYSDVDAGTTSTAAGALQFAGKGRVLGVQVIRLFERLGEFEQRLTAGIDQREYINNCAIEGLPAGACGSAGESVTVQPLTLEYATQRTGERPAGLNLSLSYNLGLGGSHGSDAAFEAVRLGAERRYKVVRMGAFAAVPVGGDWRLNYRATAQLTPDALVPGEQFGLAGANIVRGFEEREITGDNGVAGSFEVVLPAFLVPATGSPPGGFGGLRLLGFVDGGVVSNKQGLACNAAATRCHLASAGVGARFAVGPSQWKFDLAQALTDARQTQRRDLKLHFQASIAFQ